MDFALANTLNYRNYTGGMPGPVHEGPHAFFFMTVDMRGMPLLCGNMCELGKFFHQALITMRVRHKPASPKRDRDGLFGTVQDGGHIDGLMWCPLHHITAMRNERVPEIALSTAHNRFWSGKIKVPRIGKELLATLSKVMLSHSCGFPSRIVFRCGSDSLTKQLSHPTVCDANDINRTHPTSTRLNAKASKRATTTSRAAGTTEEEGDRQRTQLLGGRVI